MCCKIRALCAIYADTWGRLYCARASIYPLGRIARKVAAPLMHGLQRRKSQGKLSAGSPELPSSSIKFRGRRSKPNPSAAFFPRSGNLNSPVASRHPKNLIRFGGLSRINTSRNTYFAREEIVIARRATTRKMNFPAQAKPHSRRISTGNPNLSRCVRELLLGLFIST